MSEIYDVIYYPISESKDLKKVYPDAVIEDASDFVHEGRFSIRVQDDKKSYYENIIKLGYYDASLMFRMRLNEDDTELKEVIDRLLKSKGATK